MRFARLEVEGGTSFARLSGDQAELWSAAPWLGGKATGRVVAFRESDLRAPVDPYKILCIGRNYAAHAKEMGNDVPTEPLLFLKPRTALVGHGGIVELPPESSRVEHEAELGVVIGSSARRVNRDQALAHVFGYTCVCDVTARDLQKKDGQWSRAKGFDTFCPCGPWIETDVDARALRIRCTVNGVTKQDGSTAQMVFDVATLIEYASAAMTLEPGDLIVTGTPDGTGPIAHGDAVTVDIENVGALSFRVVAAQS
jgi:2-keto-4-pentenoate hydratase/2-oxohepta-3-ene-1,7-dioic acid hydratase in catechol pathway